MTDSDHALDAIGRVASDLVPQLTERLHRHGLGEIEVVDGDLRLRLRARAASAQTAAESATTGQEPGESAPAASDEPSGVPVGSPAVGFFVYAEGLGPGLEVGTGDAIGHVEMLGVRHDVRVPRAGTVRNLVAESGEAVEYGQVVVELDVTEVRR